VSILKSSDDHLTLNADGSGKAIKFQADGVEKASINSSGLLTSTTIDATALTGNLPAIDGSNLTGISAGTALTGSTNNTIPTVTGANAISGEANLTFDGTDLTLGTGNLVIGTSGKGIDFSATANGGDTTPSELFDDYEEGTWYVTLGGTTETLANNEGNYTKIGNIVHITWYGGSCDLASSAGEASISGLPFTSKAGTSGILNKTYNNNSVDGNNRALFVQSGDTIAYFMDEDAVAGSTFVDGNNLYVGMIAGFYMAA